MNLQKRKQQLQEEYQKAIQAINHGVKMRDRIEGALSLIDEMEKEEAESAEKEDSDVETPAPKAVFEEEKKTPEVE